MSILWSDDCLSCLAGFPHSVEQHMQAVNAASEELWGKYREDLFEDEIESTVKLSSADVDRLIFILQQSYHGC